jgi:hypothetical protein
MKEAQVSTLQSGNKYLLPSRPKRLTKRAPDAGDSAAISSSSTRLSIFPVGRLRRPRPSAGNANRWTDTRQQKSQTDSELVDLAFLALFPLSPMAYSAAFNSEFGLCRTY